MKQLRIKFYILLGILIMISLLFMPKLGVAKFTCDVKAIAGNELTLENCQEKGLKRLRPGDKVGIVKKRKKKSVEGC